MAGETTFDKVDGLTKKVYESTIKDVRPECAILQGRIGFDSAKKVGKSYEVGVALKAPNGFTYVGSGGGISLLKQARNGSYQQASITPFELILREQMSYGAIARAAEEGEGVIKSAAGEVMLGMQLAMGNRLEASMLHGQRGYGTVESVTDLGGGVAAIVITAATWAPGMWWALGVDSTWDFFTGTTKNNVSGVCILQGITASTRTLNFSYTGTLAAEIAVGDVLFPEGSNAGAGVHNDMPGLLTQASNVGTSLGLSAVTYPNWGGNAKDIGGPISYGALELSLVDLRDRGAAGKLSVYLPNLSFSELAVEIAALRSFDSSYSEKGKVGVQSIEYATAKVGHIEVVQHPFMKWGEFLILPDAECKRVGATDITMGLPGVDKKFFKFLEDYNAVEMQAMTDQAVILKKPSRALLGTGVTHA